LVKSKLFIPDCGDIVWLTFNPQSGHEQAGHRPAFIVSPDNYNRKVGLAICCPVTNQIKGYPFEIILPQGSQTQGVILSDQVKSLDWRARQARFIAHLPDKITKEVAAKITAIIS